MRVWNGDNASSDEYSKLGIDNYTLTRISKHMELFSSVNHKEEPSTSEGDLKSVHFSIIVGLVRDGGVA